MVLFSLKVFPSELQGTWRNCELQDDGSYKEHSLFFSDTNVELEFIAVFGKSTKPCLENLGVYIVRSWHYESDGNKLNRTLFSTEITLVQDDVVVGFNKNKVCGHSSWVKEKEFVCHKDKAGFFPHGLGYKTTFEYQIIGQDLYVPRNGETVMFKKEINE